MMMDPVNKKIYFTNLLNLYKELLSPAQKEVLEHYYEYDLSITEISENLKISRAAVEDALKKGETKLVSFENSLHLFEKAQNITKITANLKQKALNQKEIDEITDIERIIKNGI